MSDDDKMGASAYLGFELLKRLQQEKGRVSRTSWFKAWCLTDRYLESEFNFETNLPRHWYMYGEIPDETTVSDGFYYSKTTEWGRSYKPIYNIDLERFDISEDEKEILDQGIKWAISRFGKRDAGFIRSLQYIEHAPNEFIRTYSELRDYLEYTDLDKQTPLPRFPDYESNQDVVEHLLNEMMITYPKEEFDTMYDLYLRWDDTARLLLDLGSSFREFQDFMDEFIEALSKVEIRIRFYEDVPQERISRWMDTKEEEKQNFAYWLSNQRSGLLESRGESGVLRELSESFDESVEEELSNLNSVHER